MKTSDKTKLEEIKLAVESGVTDREFWHSRTPQERIWAIQLMNQRAYGYDEHSVPRIKRVLEIVKLKTHSDQPEYPQGAKDLPESSS